MSDYTDAALYLAIVSSLLMEWQPRYFLMIFNGEFVVKVISPVCFTMETTQGKHCFFFF